MGALRSETYIHRESVIHRWAPRLKLVSLLALMFAFATVHQLALVPWMLGLALGLYALSELPFSFLRQRLSYPGLFILAVVVLLPLTVGETVLAQWGWLTLRQEGLQATGLILGRFLSILTLGFILLGTTPFLTILNTMRRLGLPVILADMTLLAYRYLYEIADTLATMQQAMRLRGFGQAQQRWFRINGRAMQQRAMLAGNLLIRSYEQSERVYKAMRLRGYGYGVAANGTPGTPTPDPTLSGLLTGAILLAAAGIVIAEGILRQ